MTAGEPYVTASHRWEPPPVAPAEALPCGLHPGASPPKTLPPSSGTIGHSRVTRWAWRKSGSPPGPVTKGIRSALRGRSWRAGTSPVTRIDWAPAPEAWGYARSLTGICPDLTGGVVPVGRRASTSGGADGRARLHEAMSHDPRGPQLASAQDRRRSSGPMRGLTDEGVVHGDCEDLASWRCSPISVVAGPLQPAPRTSKPGVPRAASSSRSASTARSS